MFLPLFQARIYGCLCSAGKLRPVSPIVGKRKAGVSNNQESLRWHTVENCSLCLETSCTSWIYILLESFEVVSPTHTNEEMDVPLGSQPKKELTSASFLQQLLCHLNNTSSIKQMKCWRSSSKNVNKKQQNQKSQLIIILPSLFDKLGFFM